MPRPTWDEYFMNVMRVIRTRSTCRGQAGAVIVRDHRILATGYAGSITGQPHCDEVGHLLKKTVHEDGSTTEHCLRTVHAELNAILNAARHGVPLDGATMYVSMTPCIHCTKAILQAGFKRVVVEKRYQADTESIQFFAAAGVQLEILSNTLADYSTTAPAPET